MTTKNEDGMENSPQSSFITVTLTRLGNWWTVYKFERKIALSLSGLCDASPVDKIFSLVELENMFVLKGKQSP